MKKLLYWFVIPHGKESAFQLDGCTIYGSCPGFSPSYMAVVGFERASVDSATKRTGCNWDNLSHFSQM
jgi:hypothetical protein